MFMFIIKILLKITLYLIKFWFILNWIKGDWESWTKAKFTDIY